MPATIVSNVNQVGRYALGQPIASGGMATLHLGRHVGSAGFARTVAIKRLHPHLCASPGFVSAFADEARLAARIRHPNVVPTLDVVRADGELLIVMEYIDGESLSQLARASIGRIPVPIVLAIVSEMLHGLHSAHEAKSEAGTPLEIVHRDVSPQNVLVGADGVARLVDFGIARATGRAARSDQERTGEHDLKGKLAYMAPEQIRREPVTRKTDIFAAGVVLWELLTGKRLFASENDGATVEKILVGWVAPPSSVAKEIPTKLDDIVLRALDADPESRFATAREMAVALEDAMPRALGREVGAWVESTACDALAKRRALVANAEREANAPSVEIEPMHATLMQETIAKATPTPSMTVAARRNTSRPIPRDADAARTQTINDADILAALPIREEGTITAFVTPTASPAPSARAYDANLSPLLQERTPHPFDPSRAINASTWQVEESFPPLEVAGSELPRYALEDAIADTRPQHVVPAKKKLFNQTAILVFGVAAAMTAFIGTRYLGEGTARASATTTSLELTTEPAGMPIPTPAPAPAPTPTPTLDVTPTPSAVLQAPAPNAITPVTPAPLKRTAPAASPQPQKARVQAPAHAACVAKLDPATGKKVYQGDCD